jgi:hypothetical protein
MEGDFIPEAVKKLAVKYNVNYYELVVIISNVLDMHIEFTEELFMLHEALTEVLNNEAFTPTILTKIPSVLLMC